MIDKAKASEPRSAKAEYELAGCLRTDISNSAKTT
jgi:hypothetical protein